VSKTGKYSGSFQRVYLSNFFYFSSENVFVGSEFTEIILCIQSTYLEKKKWIISDGSKGTVQLKLTWVESDIN
jgi:hypothetical protein